MFPGQLIELMQYFFPAVFTVESYFVEATIYRPIFGPTRVIDHMSVLIVEKLLHVEIIFRITDGHTQVGVQDR